MNTEKQIDLSILSRLHNSYTAREHEDGFYTVVGNHMPKPKPDTNEQFERLIDFITPEEKPEKIQAGRISIEANIVTEIKQAINRGLKPDYIAMRFSISKMTVSKINEGDIYANIEPRTEMQELKIKYQAYKQSCGRNLPLSFAKWKRAERNKKV